MVSYLTLIDLFLNYSAEEWWSRFTVHTAAEALFVFQDGEEVR